MAYGILSIHLPPLPPLFLHAPRCSDTQHLYQHLRSKIELTTEERLPTPAKRQSPMSDLRRGPGKGGDVRIYTPTAYAASTASTENLQEKMEPH